MLNSTVGVCQQCPYNTHAWVTRHLDQPQNWLITCHGRVVVQKEEELSSRVATPGIDCHREVEGRLQDDLCIDAVNGGDLSGRNRGYLEWDARFVLPQ